MIILLLPLFVMVCCYFLCNFFFIFHLFLSISFHLSTHLFLSHRPVYLLLLSLSSPSIPLILYFFFYFHLRLTISPCISLPPSSSHIFPFPPRLFILYLPKHIFKTKIIIIPSICSPKPRCSIEK